MVQRIEKVRGQNPAIQIVQKRMDDLRAWEKAANSGALYSVAACYRAKYSELDALLKQLQQLPEMRR